MNWKKGMKPAAFVVMLFILYHVMSKTLTPKWNYPTFTENASLSISEFEKLLGGIDNVETFFVGTSHMEFGVNPLRLYEEYNVLTYNIATSAQPVAVTYYFVKEIFQKQHPNVVVWDVSNLFIDSYGEFAYRYVLDSVPFSKNKIDLGEACIEDQITVSKSVSDESIEKMRLSILFPLYKYHDRWDSLNKSDFENWTTQYFTMGQHPVPGLAVAGASMDEIEQNGLKLSENTGKNRYGYEAGVTFESNEEINPIYSVNISEKNLEYLRKIKKICDENDCRLLLVKIPVHVPAGQYSSSWTRLRHNAVEKAAEDVGADFLDLNYEDGVGIDWSNDSGDGGCHLNVRGAAKVTDYLGKYLLDHYDLEQVRSEEYDRKVAKHDRYVGAAYIATANSLSDYVDCILNSGMDLNIYIAAKDDMASSLTEEDMRALHRLGLQTDFGAMSYNDSFIADIESGKVIYECRSNRKQDYSFSDRYEEKTGRKDHQISITSAGYLDGNTGSILMDGIEYSTNARGINFVIFDNDSGMVIDRAEFDTWADPHNVWHYSNEDMYRYEDYLMYGN